MVAAIIDFFKEGKHLKQTKNAFIVLVPEVAFPSTPPAFSSIFLTNELFKIIARILVRRLKEIMAQIVDQCQSAFIHSRSISDNILLSHDGGVSSKSAAKRLIV